MAGCHSEVRLADDIFMQIVNTICNRRPGKLTIEKRGAEKVFLCTSILCSLEGQWCMSRTAHPS